MTHNFRVVYATPYKIEIRRTTEECDDGRQIYGSLLMARAHLSERYDVMIEQLRDAKRTWMRTRETKLPIDPVPAQAGTTSAESSAQDTAASPHAVVVGTPEAKSPDAASGDADPIIPRFLDRSAK